MAIMGLRTTVKKLNGDTLTPVIIFKRLPGVNKFLLESASLKNGAGRYSIIGANPRKSYVGRGEEVIETELATGKAYTHQGDLFTLLKRLMPRVVTESQLPFFGGAVGYISSGASRLQTAVEDELQLPDAYFNVYDTVIVFDHLLDEVTIVHTNIDPELKEPNLDELASILKHADVNEDEGYQLSSFESEVSQDEFSQLVEQAQKVLADGECSQIVVSRRLKASFTGNAFDLYRQLRKLEATPYMTYVECGEHVVISTSPVGLVKVTGDEVQASPMVGTIQRGRTEQEDLLKERALLNNEVQVNLHHKVVEHYQQDLKAVTLANTLQVIDELRPIQFQSVYHLVSQVRGTLLPMLQSLDALEACLPAVATTGVPKNIAAQAIDRIEKTHRSFYGGAIGYIGFNGNIHFALAVRSLLLHQGKAYTQVGATVTKQCEATTQFENSEQKISSLLRLSGDTMQEAK